MNKKTAVMLNKVATQYKVNPRLVRKAWYKLSDKERAKERKLITYVLNTPIAGYEINKSEVLKNAEETVEPVRADI